MNHDLNFFEGFMADLDSKIIGGSKSVNNVVISVVIEVKSSLIAGNTNLLNNLIDKLVYCWESTFQSKIYAHIFQDISIHRKKHLDNICMHFYSSLCTLLFNVNSSSVFTTAQISSQFHMFYLNKLLLLNMFGTDRKNEICQSLKSKEALMRLIRLVQSCSDFSININENTNFESNNLNASAPQLKTITSKDCRIKQWFIYNILNGTSPNGSSHSPPFWSEWIPNESTCPVGFAVFENGVSLLSNIGNHLILQDLWLILFAKGILFPPQFSNDNTEEDLKCYNFVTNSTNYGVRHIPFQLIYLPRLNIFVHLTASRIAARSLVLILPTTISAGSTKRDTLNSTLLFNDSSHDDNVEFIPIILTETIKTLELLDEDHVWATTSSLMQMSFPLLPTSLRSNSSIVTCHPVLSSNSSNMTNNVEERNSNYLTSKTESISLANVAVTDDADHDGKKKKKTNKGIWSWLTLPSKSSQDLDPLDGELKTKKSGNNADPPPTHNLSIHVKDLQSILENSVSLNLSLEDRKERSVFLSAGCNFDSFVNNNFYFDTMIHNEFNNSPFSKIKNSNSEIQHHSVNAHFDSNFSGRPVSTQTIVNSNITSSNNNNNFLIKDENWDRFNNSFAAQVSPLSNSTNPLYPLSIGSGSSATAPVASIVTSSLISPSALRTFLNLKGSELIALPPRISSALSDTLVAIHPSYTGANEDTRKLLPINSDLKIKTIQLKKNSSKAKARLMDAIDQRKQKSLSPCFKTRNKDIVSSSNLLSPSDPMSIFVDAGNFLLDGAHATFVADCLKNFSEVSKYSNSQGLNLSANQNTCLNSSRTQDKAFSSYFGSEFSSMSVAHPARVGKLSSFLLGKQKGKRHNQISFKNQQSKAELEKNLSLLKQSNDIESATDKFHSCSWGLDQNKYTDNINKHHTTNRIEERLGCIVSVAVSQCPLVSVLGSPYESCHCKVHETYCNIISSRSNTPLLADLLLSGDHKNFLEDIDNLVSSISSDPPLNYIPSSLSNEMDFSSLSKPLVPNHQLHKGGNERIADPYANGGLVLVSRLDQQIHMQHECGEFQFERLQSVDDDIKLVKTDDGVVDFPLQDLVSDIIDNFVDEAQSPSPLSRPNGKSTEGDFDCNIENNHEKSFLLEDIDLFFKQKTEDSNESMARNFKQKMFSMSQATEPLNDHQNALEVLKERNWNSDFHQLLLKTKINSSDAGCSVALYV